MRLVAGVLSFVLFAPFARAEDTATAPATPTAPPPAPVAAIPPAPAIPAARVPFRVVRVMPETRQALLFDRSRNTHILAEVGGKLDGYLIEDIDDDTVSLRRDNQQVILAAPLHGGGHSRELPPVRLRSAAAPGFDAAVPAPAASSDPRALAPIDPYADPPRPGESSAALGPASAAPPADALPADPSIRVARAPGAPGSPGIGVGAVVVPGEGGVRVATAPDVGPGPALSSAPSTLLPSAAAVGSPATGTGAIRVVSASPDPAPPSPSGLPASPGSPSAASVPAPGAWNPAPASGAGSSGAIADPIAAPPRVSPAVAIEPAADPAPGAIREVRAPDAVRAPDRQTADARALADILTADRPTRSPRAVAEPVAGHAAEARPASGGASPPAAAAGDALAISRSELDGALADFARLSAGVRGSFSANGVVVDAVGDGTIFQRAGLRAGDVVTSVDGVRLRTLDDAANLYARASTARAITAQVVRAGKPIALHVVVQ